jgi:Xaa-Pro dipeptidase
MNRRHFLSSAVLAVPAAGFAQSSMPAGDTTPLPAPIQALKSRKSEAKPITLAEREARVERARELMTEHKVDAVVITGGNSLVYFTGLRWGISERMVCFVLPAKGNGFFVCPFFEEGRLHERLVSVPGGANLRIYTWQEDESPYALVKKGLTEAAVLSGTLGIEERTPFVFANEIARACPNFKVVDGTPVISGCRMIKSPAELGLMRLACHITLQVYEAAWKSAHPGITTHDFTELCMKGYAQVGFPGEISCQTGVYSALPHGSLTPQVIQENQIVLIDDGCLVEGYQADISRTFVYGKPTDAMLRNFDIVHKAQAAALAAARPGVECQAVDAAARKVITDAGFGPDYKYFTHRVGHGLGMDMHEWTYLVRGNTTKLEANMTFSDEPGIYVPGEFGVRLEDDLAITSNGAELLTPQSPSLIHPFGA